MSPTTTGISAPFLRSSSAIAGDSSIPLTGTPASASGIATRPVPIANSRARPSPARPASKRTVGSRTSGANMNADVSSYRPAVVGSYTSLLVTGAGSPLTGLKSSCFPGRGSVASAIDCPQSPGPCIRKRSSAGSLAHRRGYRSSWNEACPSVDEGLTARRCRNNGTRCHLSDGSGSRTSTTRSISKPASAIASV